MEKINYELLGNQRRSIISPDLKYMSMVEHKEEFHFNSALIIDPENTDLFICSRMFLLRSVAKDIYTRRTIHSAISLITELENPVDIIVIDFISSKDELLEFLINFENLPEKYTKNCKIFILSALLDYYPEIIKEAFKFKNVVMTMCKPMSDENIQCIINRKD